MLYFLRMLFQAQFSNYLPPIQSVQDNTIKQTMAQFCLNVVPTSPTLALFCIGIGPQPGVYHLDLGLIISRVCRFSAAHFAPLSAPL